MNSISRGAPSVTKRMLPIPMNEPLGSPDNRITAFVGRHPRACGGVLALGGGGILWWQALSPWLIAEENEPLTLSPRLAALGFLIFIVGMAYLLAGPHLYRLLVSEKTAATGRTLRLAGYALAALTAVFYFALITHLKSRGYTIH